jgi:predicted RNA-binding Zn ribbon-like protein
LAVWELLVDADAVAHWIGVVLEVDAVRADPRRTDHVFALRRAIWAAARQVIAGHRIGPAARRVINDAAGRPPVGIELAPAGTARIAEPVTVEHAVSTLARDAVDLFGGPLARRIRECAAPDCGLLFVDQSRPGTRRWCSMQRCGTLAKVRKHRRLAQAG